MHAAICAEVPRSNPPSAVADRWVLSNQLLPEMKLGDIDNQNDVDQQQRLDGLTSARACDKRLLEVKKSSANRVWDLKGLRVSSANE